MKSKSPFAIKSPLRVQVYGGDTYESPDTVITKTVGEQVGAAITGLSKNATKYMDDYKKPEPREKAEIASSIKSDRGQVPERGFASAGKLRQETSEKIHYIGGKGKSEAQAWEDRDKVKYSEDSRDQFVKDMRADPSYGKSKNIIKQKLSSTRTYGDDKLISTTPYSPTSMKGSPNKLIGDTMDPYGQPQRGNRDFTFNENEIAPGTLGSQASVGVQKEIFGGGQAQAAAEQLAAEQLQTPLYNKGHANDYEGHTHRKKGGSYKEGDYMDETDMETSYPKLHTQDVGEIKRDKKSQFMVSKNEDYNPAKIDTIRPSKGKEFKMGWGDAERNISTNPKYKKSK